MAVEQVALYIPDDIKAKILTGEYRRNGGVVRRAVGPNKGQIVKLLESADIRSGEQMQKAGEKRHQLTKSKKGILVAGVISVAALVGFVCYKNIQQEPAALADFREALRTYTEEAENGNLQLDTIVNLQTAIEKLKKHKNYEEFRIELADVKLDAIIGIIKDYTIQLAENNKVELPEWDRSKYDDPIINLQDYLRVQNNIFEAAE